MKQTKLIVLVGVAALFGVALWGSRGISQATTISMKDFSHSPSILTVKPKETVRVKNEDVAGHTVTSDTPGIFDTGIITKGQTATITAPSTPGTYRYHCNPHPNMTGTIVVQ